MRPVFITLDKKREVKYDFNALVLLEEMGISLEDLQNGKFPLKTVRGLLYAGLVHEDPDLTVEAVGKIINPTKFTEISEKLGQALTAALGGEKPKND